MTYKSSNAWLTYRIKNLEHSLLSFYLILESLIEILSYGVIIRDKEGNFGQFDDKTFFRNESNLHKKNGILITHNISR